MNILNFDPNNPLGGARSVQRGGGSIERGLEASVSCTDSLRGSSANIGAMQRRLAWPLRKDDAHKSRSASNLRFK